MERPAWFTKKQMELLLKITPYPIGEGKTIKEASEELDISRNAAFLRLKSFKRRFPKAWKDWKILKKIDAKTRTQLRRWDYVDNNGNCRNALKTLGWRYKYGGSSMLEAFEEYTASDTKSNLSFVNKNGRIKEVW